MDLGREFETDPVKVADGVWFRLVGSTLVPARETDADGDFAEFRLRPTDTAAAEKVMRTRQLQYRGALDEGEGPAYDQALVDLAAGVLADAVVVDWRNVDVAGKPVPFSRAAAFELLRNYPRLRRMIDVAASSVAPYRPERDEAAVGN